MEATRSKPEGEHRLLTSSPTGARVPGLAGAGGLGQRNHGCLGLALAGARRRAGNFPGRGQQSLAALTGRVWVETARALTGNCQKLYIPCPVGRARQRGWSAETRRARSRPQRGKQTWALLQCHLARIPKSGSTPALGRGWARPRGQLPAREAGGHRWENSAPPKFSARARKTAPGAGAVPTRLGNLGLVKARASAPQDELDQVEFLPWQ